MTAPNLRAALKQHLKGSPLPRPLFIPILFAAAAKVEGAPPERFLSNPTPLANTLRRMQSPLRLDGVTCYWDSLVEAEALGCKLDWSHYPPTVVERPSRPADAPPDTRVEGIETRGRIPVALDVVRRLRVMMGDATLLVVGVTGPFALARQLAGEANIGRLSHLLETTPKVFLRLAQQLGEAGADVVVTVEDPPESGSGVYSYWKDVLASVGKVIRFFEALPVLLVPRQLEAEELDAILAGHNEFVPCPTVDSLREGDLARLVAGGPFGLALPPELLENPRTLAARLERYLPKPRPETDRLVLLTTVGEIPYGWNVKRLPALLAAARAALQ